MNKWNLKLKTQCHLHYHPENEIHINLTKYVQDLYEENYKTLMNEIKDKLNKWRAIPQSWIGRFNIVKLSLFPKSINRSSAIPFKIPASYFVGINLILKFT